MPRAVAVSDANFTTDECVDGKVSHYSHRTPLSSVTKDSNAFARLPDTIFAIRQVPQWDVPVFLVINDWSGARADGCQESRMKQRARR